MTILTTRPGRPKVPILDRLAPHLLGLEPGILSQALAQFPVAFAGVEDCWVWAGPTRKVGRHHYPVVGRYFHPRRVFYEALSPEIGSLRLQPICTEPLCVNPYHAVLLGKSVIPKAVRVPDTQDDEMVSAIRPIRSLAGAYSTFGKEVRTLDAYRLSKQDAEERPASLPVRVRLHPWLPD